MSQVKSKDGTTIAYERSGSGPALILVDGALCSRAFGPSPKLAPLLARHFTVYVYDRRGRGRERRHAAVSPRRARSRTSRRSIEAAGGSAFLLGLSSGGALALEAAASGLPINKVVAYEPPYVDDTGQRGGAAHAGQLKRLLAGGNRGGAVKYFMKDMVGAPAPLVVHDAADAVDLAQARSRRPHPPIRRGGDDRVPDSAGALRVDRGAGARDERVEDRSQVEGSRAGDRADAIPGAHHRELPGQTHNVKPEVADAGGGGVPDGADGRESSRS